MGIPPVLLGMLLVSMYAFLWIGVPILLTTWVRKRREEAIRLQIALTDAIHWEFGAIASPVVENPVWGPRQVRIDAPLSQPAMVGRILAVIHAVLSAAEPTNPIRYRVTFTPTQAPTSAEGESRAGRIAEKWAGDTIAAA
jgi:hypothetical protein